MLAREFMLISRESDMRMGQSSGCHKAPKTVTWNLRYALFDLGGVCVR